MQLTHHVVIQGTVMISNPKDLENHLTFQVVQYNSSGLINFLYSLRLEAVSTPIDVTICQPHFKPSLRLGSRVVSCLPGSTDWTYTGTNRYVMTETQTLSSPIVNI